MTEGDRTTGRMTARLSQLRATQRARSDDRFAERFAQQWSQIRAERAPEPPTIDAGPTNWSRAQVPWAFDLAAAWSWRLLVIAAAGYVVLWIFDRFSVIFLPLAIALLLAALAAPVVESAAKVRIHRKLAAAVVVLGGLGTVVLLLTFVGTQVSAGVSDLSGQVVDGLEEIRRWLRDGPLNASDSQINDYIQQAQQAVSSSSEQAVKRATEVGTTIGHIVAGIFIVLFATYFFLADGDRIWAWFVRLFPRAARKRTDESGRVAWRSLTQFVRVTVIIAFVDALGVFIAALVLQVPFAIAIGVLVFLGAFIPMVGATLSGSVAVLVALVAQGPFIALLMLGAVIAVQQLEAHVLQPFLTGRFVSLHPLGVIVAIGMGVLVAGIAGALLAVPLVAALNAVAQYLAGYTEVGESAEEAAVDDPGTPEPSEA
ncbi:AI-2E family transporter [Nocardioides mesophilus]|uniref:AI-2E family transporter n=1 Tax=Nocardioides mesophilus TaxID=433659 RepID=A0A7G9R7R7_9ACTN|nr:AI-2E family transporter [Nocardioides mesophilus]QNN51642.1 AI-2E family transporter [Nocardioides mesophilus]